MKKQIATVAALLLCGAAIADWKYQIDKNLMTDEVYSTFAAIENPTQPFGKINVINRKESGFEVSITNDASTIDCPSPSCRILVRFDDNAPIWFQVKPALSIFFYIINTDEFVHLARKARRIRVQANFMPKEGLSWSGEQVMEFKATQPLVVQPLVKGLK
ncbi:MAG: hypothetical protein Q7T10_16245 [Rhodoferax sp.]|uniref:hypothetical protein n=1 Tax=Rhodoferax sp. TaxID=50421 RepID=UPI002725D8C0|nr:hypothetical protein [Rhodoferax sp.]MDO8450350.1 hypothetical protein [Rhodoferax sp.]